MKRTRQENYPELPEPYTTFWENGEGWSLVVNITDEGIILDAYSVDEDGNDELVGTMGMTAEEWFDFVEER